MNVKIITIVAGILFLNAGYVVASDLDLPTYDDTVEFIKSKIVYDRINRYNMAQRTDYKFVETERCIFNYTGTTRENGFLTSFKISSIDFSHIDPTRNNYDLNGFWVDIYSTADTDSVYKKIVEFPNSMLFESVKTRGDYSCLVGDNPNCLTVFQKSSARIWAKYNGTTSNAVKVARAFKHLSTLCGGKKEIF